MSTTVPGPRARRRVAVPGSQTGWIVAAIVATIAAVTTGVVVGLDDGPTAAPSTTGLDEDAALRDLQNRGLVPTAPAVASSAGDLRLQAEAERLGAAESAAMTGGDQWLISEAEEIRRQRANAAWTAQLQGRADEQQPTVFAGDLGLLQKAAELEAV
jgi:hypothetical protein